MPERNTLGSDLTGNRGEDQVKSYPASPTSSTGQAARPAVASEGTSSPALAGESATGQTAEAAGRKARDLGAQAKGTMREAGERIQEQGAETAERLRRQGEKVAEDQKSWAADELSHLSGAVRSAADHLHEEEDHRLADYAATTAERLDQVSHYLRDKDWRELVDDAEEVGRRRPEVFLGGLFLAGVGIARFLKASGRRAATQREEPSWAGGGPSRDYP